MKDHAETVDQPNRFRSTNAGRDLPPVKLKSVCPTCCEKVYQRLASLDEETQERISRKYYSGTRPWAPKKESESATRRRRQTKR